MRTLRITVSNRDYRSVWEHFQRDKPGKPLVAVASVLVWDGPPDDVEEED